MDKKMNKYLVAIIIIALLVFGALLYYIHYSPKPTIMTIPEVKPAERDVNKILESLSAPSESSKPLLKKVLDSLSAPKEGENPSKNVLKSLSAPE